MRILQLEEGHFHELKGKAIRPGKLTETVSAFANASGGEIYLGVDELDRDRAQREWNGFGRIEDANAFIQEIERLFPLGNHYRAEFLRAAGQSGLVLLLTIFKTKDILRSSSGIAYVRRCAQKLPITEDHALERLRLDKGITSFEDSTVDVEPEVLGNSEVIIDFILNVLPSSEPIPWLKKQRLLVREKPTVGGVLLFSDEPQALLPKRCGIKVFRYKTKDRQGSRDQLAFNPITIEGAACSSIYAAVAETKRVIEGIQKLGPAGLELVSYPEETVHEIVTNAVLHRDYSILADVQIRIFDNRVEIESPGVLPGHVTTENILEVQFARNPQLVRIANKFPNPPNKDVGEGLNAAFEAMRKLRLQEPEIIEREASVVVILRHEPLASPEETVMRYLENNEEIANRTGRELTGITSENEMNVSF